MRRISSAAAAVLLIVGGLVGAYGVTQILDGDPVAAAATDPGSGNTSNRTWILQDTVDRYHVEVHAVRAANETIVTLQSVGGVYSHNNSDANHSRTVLWLRVSAFGGDVRASFTPDGCTSDRCRVEMTTTQGGQMQEVTLRNRPPDTWRWRVDAIDTTVDPIDAKVVWDWTTVVPPDSTS